MHYAELIERLRASVNGPAAFGGTALVNPDGPEAATALEAQAAQLEAIQGPPKGAEHPDWLSDLLNISRDVVDEGDRVYFGSTNDADDLRDVVEALEQAHHPLHLFRRPDLHRHNAELRKLNEAQAARIAELEGALREIALDDGGSFAGNPHRWPCYRAVAALVGKAKISQAEFNAARQALTKGTDHEG